MDTLEDHEDPGDLQEDPKDSTEESSNNDDEDEREETDPSSQSSPVGGNALALLVPQGLSPPVTFPVPVIVPGTVDPLTPSPPTSPPLQSPRDCSG